MPDLLWDDVRWFFDPGVMGALPDVCVPGASVEDWQSVLDLVVAQGWAFQYSCFISDLRPRVDPLFSSCPNLVVSHRSEAVRACC